MTYLNHVHFSLHTSININRLTSIQSSIKHYHRPHILSAFLIYSYQLKNFTYINALIGNVEWWSAKNIKIASQYMHVALHTLNSILYLQGIWQTNGSTHLFLGLLQSEHCYKGDAVPSALIAAWSYHLSNICSFKLQPLLVRMSVYIGQILHLCSTVAYILV